MSPPILLAGWLAGWLSVSKENLKEFDTNLKEFYTNPYEIQPASQPATRMWGGR